MSAHGGSGQEGVMHAEFMAFVGDEESLATLRGWAEKQGFPAASVQSGGPAIFAQMLESASPPKLVIIDIDGQDDAVGTAARLVSLCGSTGKLIAVGSANDVSLYRRMLGAGVTDYLVKPLSPDMLSQATTAAARGAMPGKAETKGAKVVVMIGVRGGVGTSTIAVNTSWLLAHQLKLNTVLLDLDLQFGTSALALDLEPGRGLRDVISSPQRVDSLMIASSMVTESDQFSVLGAEEAVDEIVSMDSSAVTALLQEMTGNFEMILIDMPRHLLATQKRLLSAAQEIILVSELSLAGIRDTLRIRQAIAALGCPAKVSVIAARTGPSHPAQVDPAAFEKGAQIKIQFTIPEDPKTIADAANTGKALGSMAAAAPVTKALLEFASAIGGKTTAAAGDSKQPAGLWDKIVLGIAGKEPPPRKEPRK